ncbi:hypothetical protein T11_12890 [Trichinella zimbabwensis]|uniref:Uncharacterized protein n=1 Tax=Trichinella zimbabwensis TaxID=268475 RepID=A0A0V1GK88_9BILA|nr:hypothetical protein T11_12890 [Trichinella zimbabwensis]
MHASWFRFKELQCGCFPRIIDNKKSENYNELRRTLHESVSV